MTHSVKKRAVSIDTMLIKKTGRFNKTANVNRPLRVNGALGLFHKSEESVNMASISVSVTSLHIDGK